MEHQAGPLTQMAWSSAPKTPTQGDADREHTDTPVWDALDRSPGLLLPEVPLPQTLAPTTPPTLCGAITCHSLLGAGHSGAETRLAPDIGCAKCLTHRTQEMFGGGING